MTIAYNLTRRTLADGAVTTVYATLHPRASTRIRVAHFPQPRRLDVWCAAQGEPEAIIGGFFLRDPFRPLGELRRNGAPADHAPVADGYAPARAAVHAHEDGIALGPRAAFGDDPPGDLLQAGPLLIKNGKTVYKDAADPEGFSATVTQFDSDITAGRHPRAALGLSDDHVIALACDGRRSGVDAGLTMTELAQALRDLGATDAINLDGGGSTTLVHQGHLLNRPYSEQDQPAPKSRPIVSALLLRAAASGD
ncbi:phosphodiester glycosidase family protein [Baekduia sp. Peel2402]|uniref:phosphodiester glycosidase family protein n=1 Tax=Baekduia sp. Peel2402 TaxID=3458296 RepID=UPI00403EE93B